MVSVTITITNSSDKTQKLAITLPISLLEKIDKNRDYIPRSKYTIRAIESYLKAKES